MQDNSELAKGNPVTADGETLIPEERSAPTGSRFQALRRTKGGEQGGFWASLFSSLLEKPAASAFKSSTAGAIGWMTRRRRCDELSELEAQPASLDSEEAAAKQAPATGGITAARSARPGRSAIAAGDGDAPGLAARHDKSQPWARSPRPRVESRLDRSSDDLGFMATDVDREILNQPQE